MKVKHGVHFRVLHFFPDVCADDLDFGFGVSEMAGEKGIGERFEAFHDLKVIPGAHFFLLGWKIDVSNYFPTCRCGE